MTFDEAFEKKIEEIMGGQQCPKGFECYKSGFETLCKAKVVGMESQVLVCLEEHPQKCKFLDLMGGYLCECPLRIYLAKKLKK